LQPQTPRINEKELKLISDLVYQHTGIRLGPEKRHLIELRLGKILRNEKIPSYEEYYRRVISDKSGQELRRLLEALTTNFSLFFREKQHFEFLKELLKRESLRKKPFSIWSSACACGEEPYSIAITILEALNPSLYKVEIIASDISTHALKLAQEGLYPPESLKDIPPLLLKKYFIKEENGFRVKSEVKSLVKFLQFNLLSPPPWREYFDVIFCRNVMIYFDENSRMRALGNLLQALKPGGFLVLGHVEAFLGRMMKGLELLTNSIYRKRDETEGSRDR
jgi:chemotaxis protein methyltransferase CheR